MAKCYSASRRCSRHRSSFIVCPLLLLALLGSICGGDTTPRSVPLDPDRIQILPLGRVEPAVIQFLARELAARFPVTVRILHGRELPAYAWDADREQYLAPMILDTLTARRRNRLTCEPLPGRLLAVMTPDLSAPGLNFVFGQADMVDRVAVVSLSRLREERYARPANQAKTLTRLVREAVHELGHTYGLGHCPDSNCVMFFSNSLSDTDRKSSHFCAHCRSTIPRR